MEVPLGPPLKAKSGSSGGLRVEASSTTITSSLLHWALEMVILRRQSSGSMRGGERRAEQK